MQQNAFIISCQRGYRSHIFNQLRVNLAILPWYIQIDMNIYLTAK